MLQLDGICSSPTESADSPTTRHNITPIIEIEPLLSPVSSPPSPFALRTDISNYQPFTAVGDNEEEDNNNDNDGRDENLAQNIEVLTYQSNVGGWEQDASLMEAQNLTE